MALEMAFHEVYRRLHALHDTLAGLRTTVVEDKPLEGDVVLVDLFGDAADDLLGMLDEALAAAAEGRHVVMPPVDLMRAQRAMIICQRQFNRIAQRFSSDLMCYERIAELKRFGRRRGGEWRAWAAGVKAALDGCQQPMFDANEALFTCWQELTERIGTTAISVQATGIGQHMTVPSRPSMVSEERA